MTSLEDEEAAEDDALQPLSEDGDATEEDELEPATEEPAAEEAAEEPAAEVVEVVEVVEDVEPETGDDVTDVPEADVPVEEPADEDPADAETTPQRQLILLRPGLNVVGYTGPLLPVERAFPADVAQAIEGVIKALPDAGSGDAWFAWSFSHTDSTNSIVVLEPGATYVLLANKTAVWSLPFGAWVRTEAALSRGWNAVIYQGPTLPVAEALSTIGESVVEVIGFEGVTQTWPFWRPAEAGGLSTLQNGQAYFVFASRSVSWVFPAPVSQ